MLTGGWFPVGIMVRLRRTWRRLVSVRSLGWLATHEIREGLLQKSASVISR
jgi:hypothetical protein